MLPQREEDETHTDEYILKYKANSKTTGLI